MKSNSQSEVPKAVVCPSGVSRAVVKRLRSLLILVGITSALAQEDPSLYPTLRHPPEAESQSIWENGVGEGFRATTASMALEGGALGGIACFGSQQAHDIGLLSLSYGHMLGAVKGTNHWYRGNFEVRAELFGGMQFHPDVDTDGWVVGLTPHLRYNFATGTRWIPFVDAGAGVTATGIGAPDLSGTFEFNLQAGGGLHWFLTHNLALTVEARYLHLSCAGISKPNNGVNGVAGFLGLTYFL